MTQANCQTDCRQKETNGFVSRPIIHGLSSTCSASRLNKLFLLDHSNIQTRPTISTAVLVVVDAFCPDRAFAKVEDLMPFGWNFSSDRSCFAPVFIAEPCWPIIHQPVRSSVNAAWSLSSLLPSQALGLLRLELRTAVPSV
jgi:hypothetical protein